jgi:hypothetical protein
LELEEMMTAIAALLAATLQDMPKPQKEHEWLQQIVGEWEAEVEAVMAPDQPPVKSKGTEVSRMVGGFWAILENKGEMMGAPFTGIMTLGYDPTKKKHVGTWIDSMTSHLWTYEGTVDDSGKVLTLETQGPGHDDPAKIVKYRETIEIKDKDHKIFRSSREVEGKWVNFLTIHYRRKK